MHFNTEVIETLPLCQSWTKFKVSNNWINYLVIDVFHKVCHCEIKCFISCWNCFIWCISKSSREIVWIWPTVSVMLEVKFYIYFVLTVSKIHYRRILCLTDGEDNHSKTTALEAANFLRVMKIFIINISLNIYIIVWEHHRWYHFDNTKRKQYTKSNMPCYRLWVIIECSNFEYTLCRGLVFLTNKS